MNYNPSQNMFTPIYEIKYGRAFMESLIADFVQFSCAIAKFLFLDNQFWKFPHFLRSLILCRSVAHAVTHTFNFW